jgi:hypothetical protein
MTKIKCQACLNSDAIFIKQDPVEVEMPEYDESMNPYRALLTPGYYWCERCYEARLNLLRDPW